MEAYKIEAHLRADGTLLLTDLPFPAGARLEIIVLGENPGKRVNRYPLRGTAYRYDAPFEPVAEEDWEALT